MAFRKHSTEEYKGDGKFIKWDKLGTVVEGTWVRVVESRFKDAKTGLPKIEAIVNVGDEEKSLNLTTALIQFFEAEFGGVRKVPSGAEFRITFTGTKAIPGQPQPMKVFDVEFDESAFPTDEPGF